MSLDADEIKERLEKIDDETQHNLEGAEGTDEEPLWRDIALNIRDAIAVLDFILLLRSQERELTPDPDLVIFIEREERE